MSKLSQYDHLYRAFDVHTTSFIKPDDLLGFGICILVPDTKRWQSTKSPPRNGSINGVHGVLGYDSNAKRILLSLQDIDYIPQDDKSASSETVSLLAPTAQRTTRKHPFASSLKRARPTLAPAVQVAENPIKAASTSPAIGDSEPTSCQISPSVRQETLSIETLQQS